MKLRDWAEKQGISYKTAWVWFKEGANDTKKIALYARVSSADQKNDLDRQLSRLLMYANEKGLSVAKSITEIGSGMNGHRTKLMKLLQDNSVDTIIVEHRDRLMRFGFEYVEAAMAAQGRKIIVVDETELKSNLVQDIIEILTSFCARLYGKRSAKNKATKAIEVIENEG